MFCSCAKLRGALQNKHSVISYVRKLLRSDRQAFRSQATRSNAVILGIETSCDDTAIGVVDDQGNVLGESSHSQLETHNEYGGIIPPIARDLHQQHIDRVAERALKECPVPAEGI
ncbi:putative tRNA N6-adenosine threonylcarbamoyltransferase, mitochondrial [Ixodes scapularis]